MDTGGKEALSFSAGACEFRAGRDHFLHCKANLAVEFSQAEMDREESLSVESHTLPCTFGPAVLSLIL